jgi:hypothetical protein
MKPRTLFPALLTGFLLATAGLKAAESQPAGPDWVYYATIEIAGAKQDLFFLQSKLKTTADGHIQVWTKGLSDYRLARVKLTEAQVQRAIWRTFAKPSSLPGVTADERNASRLTKCSPMTER